MCPCFSALLSLGRDVSVESSFEVVSFKGLKGEVNGKPS